MLGRHSQSIDSPSSLHPPVWLLLFATNSRATFSFPFFSFFNPLFYSTTRLIPGPSSPFTYSTDAASNLHPRRATVTLLSTIFHRIQDLCAFIPIQPFPSRMFSIRRTLFFYALFASAALASPIEQIYHLRLAREESILYPRQDQSALSEPVTFQTVTTSQSCVGNDLCSSRDNG